MPFTSDVPWHPSYFHTSSSCVSTENLVCTVLCTLFTSHKIYWNGPQCAVSLIKGNLTQTSHFNPQIRLVVFLSLVCS